MKRKDAEAVTAFEQLLAQNGRVRRPESSAERVVHRRQVEEIAKHIKVDVRQNANRRHERTPGSMAMKRRAGDMGFQPN
jgi:hypothetical protein